MQAATGPPVAAYPFPVWCTLYGILIVLGFFASLFAMHTMHKHAKLVSSCVCSSMLCFFVWKTFFSICRAVTVGAILTEFRHNTSTWFMLDEDHDIGGLRFVGKGDSSISEPPLYIRISLFGGDIALLSGAYWMLVLVIEMLRLVKTTVDRGAVREKRITRFYILFNLLGVLAYATATTAVSLTTDRSFYSSRFYSFSVASCVAQSVVIVVVTLGVLYLNCTGHKLESVECRIVQKPLYTRLKLILWIFDVTGIPFVAVGWALAVKPMSPQESLDSIPNWILFTSNTLFFMSPMALAFALIANQRCMLSWCMVPDDVIQQIQANEPPKDFPVFVNTDIEASSALWGALGPVMHAAQDLHDTLLRTLLVSHRGYEIATAGDSFQLAFHNIADAVAYCLDVQLQLLVQPWPQAFVDCHIPGSATITTHQFRLLRQKNLFHGVRVRMGVHASNPAEGNLVNRVHPVTGRTTYVGLSELIGREVSDIGCGGQIIVTAPIVRWVRANQKNGTPWATAHPLELRELGVHRIEDLDIVVGIAQVVPLELVDRFNIFPPLGIVEGRRARVPATNYSLLISPQRQSQAVDVDSEPDQRG